jgi:hypothetical protein
MAKETTADRVRSYCALHYIEPARRRGERTVQITAGEVHRALRLHNVLPNVCQALRGPKFREEQHLAIDSVEGPPSGAGSKLKITYRLLHDEDAASNSHEDLPLLRLIGAGKEVFKSLGGAEEFIRHDREHFYGDKDEL